MGLCSARSRQFFALIHSRQQTDYLGVTSGEWVTTTVDFLRSDPRSPTLVLELCERIVKKPCDCGKASKQKKTKTRWISFGKKTNLWQKSTSTSASVFQVRWFSRQTWWQFPFVNGSMSTSEGLILRDILQQPFNLGAEVTVSLPPQLKRWEQWWMIYTR